MIVGEGTDDVGEALAAHLARTGLTIATAESCTGGLLAHQITTVPGASEHLLGGLVTYSAESKVKLLGIPSDLIDHEGVVSAAVAGSMAAQARERFGADVGLGITGYAGPKLDDSALPGQTIGLVYVGLAMPGGEVTTRKLELGPEQPRDVIQRRAAKMALNFARLALRQQPDAPGPV